MRTGWIIAAAALVASSVGCSASEETLRADAEYTTGGEGKPVGPSRVARPLDEAGPRANYPDFDHFDVVTDRGDPMMEEEPTVPAGDCPATLTNLDIDVTDVYDGAAIIVTGDLSQAAPIQASARNMVETEAALADAPALAQTADPDDDAELGGGVGKPEGTVTVLPGTRSEVVDLALGVRISFYAQDPDDVIEVRNAVRRIASAMQAGECPTAETAIID